MAYRKLYWFEIRGQKCWLPHVDPLAILGFLVITVYHLISMKTDVPELLNAHQALYAYLQPHCAIKVPKEAEPQSAKPACFNCVNNYLNILKKERLFFCMSI